MTGVTKSAWIWLKASSRHMGRRRPVRRFSQEASARSHGAVLRVQPRCLVAMEACASAHHWARELERLGREVRLIAPAYVKPFVKRQKNDASDAEAICEAAQQPTMRFVAVKSEAKQALAAVFRTRDLLVGRWGSAHS